VNPNVLEEHVVSIFRAEATKLGSVGIRVLGRQFEGRRVIRDMKCEKKCRDQQGAHKQVTQKGARKGVK
jgi:hypothetical protein